MNLDITNQTFSATQIAAALGVLIPFLTAVSVKLHATGWLKTAMAYVFTGLAAVASVAIAAGSGTFTLKQLIVSAVIAAATAGGTRVSLTQTHVNRLAVATKDIGIGTPVSYHPGGTGVAPSFPPGTMGKDGPVK